MRDLSDLVAELMASVLLMLGQPALDPPQVVAADPSYLQERVCGRPCRVFAWYSPEGIIYLDKRLDPERDLAARSILVHELVHHAQQAAKRGPAANCLEWAAREREAYAIQARWLRQHQVRIKKGWPRLSLVKCVSTDALNPSRKESPSP